MRRAQHRDAAGSSRFYFRTQIGSDSNRSSKSLLEQLGTVPSVQVDGLEPDFEEMTMDEIIHGKQSRQFPGLMHLVLSYVDKADANEQVKKRIKKYLDFISGRASGQSPYQSISLF